MRAPTSCCSASSRPTAAAHVSGPRSRSACRQPVVSQVSELTVEGGVADRQAPDRVRLRHDSRAAAGGRRGRRFDQHAEVPVAQGDHGREEEAAGDARRGRCRRCRGVSARRSSRSVRRRARGESQKIDDDGSGAEKILEFLVAEEVRLMAKTLVFLEHHDGAIAKGSLGVLSEGRAARRRGRRRAGRVRRARAGGDRGRLRRGDGVGRGRRSRLGRAAAAAARRRAREARARRGLRHRALRAVGARRRRRGGSRRAARRRAQLGPRRLRRRDGQGAAARRHGVRRRRLVERREARDLPRRARSTRPRSAARRR